MVVHCQAVPVNAAIAKTVSKRKLTVSASGVVIVTPKKIAALVKPATTVVRKNLTVPVRYVTTAMRKFLNALAKPALIENGSTKA